jgi:hypothetical protein
MKNAVYWTIAIVLFGALLSFCTAQSAKADGLTTTYDDPHVIEPAPSGWDGPYVGLSYGRVSKNQNVTETTETVECFKLNQPKACDDPIFTYYPEYKEERITISENTISLSTSENRAGLHLGYRWDMGKAVAGVELGIYDGKAIPGIQLGWDAGKILPYAHLDSDGPAVGIEAKLSTKLRAGIRAGENGGMLTISMGF